MYFDVGEMYSSLNMSPPCSTTLHVLTHLSHERGTIIISILQLIKQAQGVGLKQLQVIELEIKPKGNQTMVVWPQTEL